MTFKRINNAILPKTGLVLVGTRGDGYFYFLDSEGFQVGQSVYVCYLNQLTLEQWVERAEWALSEGRV